MITHKAELLQLNQSAYPRQLPAPRNYASRTLLTGYPLRFTALHAENAQHFQDVLGWRLVAAVT